MIAKPARTFNTLWLFI